MFKLMQKMSMIDGKMHTAISGLGGAFCCLCNIDIISSGFKVNRSVDDTLKICEKNLHLEENRKKEDYDIRKGETQVPITTEDINNMHPLHNLLRCFGWIFKRPATAGHLSWSRGRHEYRNSVLEYIRVLRFNTRVYAKTKLIIWKS